MQPTYLPQGSDPVALTMRQAVPGEEAPQMRAQPMLTIPHCAQITGSNVLKHRVLHCGLCPACGKRFKAEEDVTADVFAEVSTVVSGGTVGKEDTKAGRNDGHVSKKSRRFRRRRSKSSKFDKPRDSAARLLTVVERILSGECLEDGEDLTSVAAPRISSNVDSSSTTDKAGTDENVTSGNVDASGDEKEESKPAVPSLALATVSDTSESSSTETASKEDASAKSEEKTEDVTPRNPENDTASQKNDKSSPNSTPTDDKPDSQPPASHPTHESREARRDRHISEDRQLELLHNVYRGMELVLGRTVVELKETEVVLRNMFDVVGYDLESMGVTQAAECPSRSMCPDQSPFCPAIPQRGDWGDRFVEPVDEFLQDQERVPGCESNFGHRIQTELNRPGAQDSFLGRYKAAVDSLKSSPAGATPTQQNPADSSATTDQQNAQTTNNSQTTAGSQQKKSSKNKKKKNQLQGEAKRQQEEREKAEAEKKKNLEELNRLKEEYVKKMRLRDCKNDVDRVMK